MDARLVADVKLSEALKLHAYRDSKGYWTIGYGHLLSLDKTIDLSHVTCTEAQAEEWFEADLATAQHQAANLPEWASMDTPCRQNALTELVFNMGPTRWKGFKDTRAAMQRKDWPTTAVELIDSEWYKEVHPTRGDRLATYLRSGSYFSVAGSSSLQ